jgi:hypothetical protein
MHDNPLYMPSVVRRSNVVVTEIALAVQYPVLLLLLPKWTHKPSRPHHSSRFLRGTAATPTTAFEIILYRAVRGPNGLTIVAPVAFRLGNNGQPPCTTIMALSPLSRISHHHARQQQQWPLRPPSSMNAFNIIEDLGHPKER